MKKKFIFCFSVFVFFWGVNASAQFVFGDHVIKVVDLPNIPEYSDTTNFGSTKYLDLGILHKQFSIGFPLWNYGEPKYVLYREKSTGESSKFDYITYELKAKDIALFQEQYGIPPTPEIPFWDKWGGKLAFILSLVLIFIWVNRK